MPGLSPSTKKQKLGIARQFINDNFSEVNSGDNIVNGRVLYIYYSNNSSLAKTLHAIQDISAQHKSRIARLVNKAENFKRLTNGQEFERFKSLCYELFEVSCIEHRTVSSSSSSVSASSSGIPKVITAKCCTCVRLRSRLKTAIQQRALIHKKHIQRINDLRVRLHKRQCTRILNQKIKRKNVTINNLKCDVNSKNRNELNRYRTEVNNWKRKCRRLKQKSDSKLKEVAHQLKSQNEIIRCLEDEITVLKDGKEDKCSSSCENKESRMYSFDTRLFVYDAIVNQVPSNNVPKLLSSYMNRSGVKHDRVPHRTTVEQMTRELGVITDVQTVEKVINNSNLTLGFDATTQEGVHINSIHVTFKDSCLVLAVDQLPGGCATDYRDHICEYVDHLANIYSSYKLSNYQDIRQQIINSITNTLTDRANVNHATIVLLNEAWNTSLNELNCHLHPLDTIASTCRSGLKSTETNKGKLYGSDCKAANIILQLNKLRYKDGKGDPQGFKTFLSDNSLPSGFIPRYRGNRLHILFHIAGKYFAYREAFMSFLQSGPALGGLRSSLLGDFVLPESVCELYVLGLLGKYLTGPWMQCFYTSSAKEINHIDGIGIVKGVISEIEAQLLDCNTILDRKVDFFGNEFDAEDKILKSVKGKPADSVLFLKMMTSCLTSVITVLQRQYNRYFNMNITQTLKDETASARSHNIDAEEVMGMFSAAQKRAPNATLSYLSSNMRAQKNRAVEYLDSLDTRDEQDKLIRFSVASAKKLRQKHRKDMKNVITELSRRTSEKTEKKNMTLRNKLEKRLKKIDPEQTSIQKEFPDLSEDMVQDLGDILRGLAIGRRILHVWYNEDPRVKAKYNGKLEKLKKKGSTYVIGYWGETESYDDAVDYDVSKYELAADLLEHDLVLL